MLSMEGVSFREPTGYSVKGTWVFSDEFVHLLREGYVFYHERYQEYRLSNKAISAMVELAKSEEGE